MAGLDPAIHVSWRREIKDVDARHKAGHDEFSVCCYNSNMKTRLVRGLKPMHPGKMLREDVMPALGKPKAEIARLLGISRQKFYDILDEKQPVTPGMALRLGKLLGNVPISGSVCSAPMISLPPSVSLPARSSEYRR
jgi:addiction module HigA family antidote